MMSSKLYSALIIDKQNSVILPILFPSSAADLTE